MKIITVIGARPQFIKAATVSRAIIEYNNKIGGDRSAIREIIVHTGQHFDANMSDVFFKELDIPNPDYHLGINSASHGAMTGRMLEKIEEVLIKERPNGVLVYGDTNSTLAGALAAAKLHIPVAHVEAGLRSYNKKMPEEINRILTDHASDILFCPTENAVSNLKKEGVFNIVNDGRLVDNLEYISLPSVLNVGDVMYDALLMRLEIAERESKVLEILGLAPKDYYVVTLHREENTADEDKLSEIIEFVNQVAKGKCVIFPMHPRTKKACENSRIRFADNIRIIDPLGHFDMLVLLKNSGLAMTDSGGMQKEAYWLHVSCITLRDETEWIETVQSGWNVLYKDYNGVLPKPSDANTTCYGDGWASKRIINVLYTVSS